MYKKIFTIVFYKNWHLSCLLLFSILMNSILAGLGIGIIAPLLNIDKHSSDPNHIATFFIDIFNAIGLELSIINILFLSFFILLITALLTVFISFLQKEIQLGFEISNKDELYSLLSNTRLNKLFSMDFGNIIYVIQQETRMAGMLIEYLIRFLAGIFNALIFFIMLCFISIKMTAYIGIVICIVFLCLKKLYSKAKKIGLEIGTINDMLQRNVNYMLYGYKTVKAYLTYGVLLEEQKALLSDYKKKNMKIAIAESVSSSIFRPISLLIVISSYSVYHYSVAELCIFVAAIVKLYQSLQHVQNVRYKLSYHYASLERISGLRDLFWANQYDYCPSGKEPTFNSSMDLKNLSFSYLPEINVLNDVHVTIPFGSKIGLVGQSGSGKSTMVDLLMRFYEPKEGHLFLDGQNLAEVDYNKYIGHIGYVSQEPFMLNASVRDNVSLFRKISDDEIIEGLKKANAWKFVSDLNDGLDTILGENGTMLSGGQKQRMSLARALAGNPKILILDEATSALDNESERKVQDAIDKLGNDITVIIIAHRLSTVRNVDNIYVLKNGKVVQEGSYDLLAAVSGEFRKFIDASIT